MVAVVGRTAKDLGHVYWTAGSALYRAPIEKASGAVMLAPAVGRSSVGRHRSVVGRADRSLACSLTLPPICHPTGVLARGLWLSASPTPLQFRQQGVREREYATASATDGAGSGSSLRVAHLDRRVASHRRPFRSSPIARANQGGAGSKSRPAPTPSRGAWIVVRSRTSHGAPTSRTPATRSHPAGR